MEMSEAAPLMFTVVPNSSAAQTPATSQQQAEQAILVPTATAEYRLMDSSPPPFQLIPHGAVIIRHVDSGDKKRKRGRPRKFAPDSRVVAAPQPVSFPMEHNISSATQQPVNFDLQQNVSPVPQQMESQPPISGSVPLTIKKAMGRPPGSKNKKQRTKALGSSGVGLIPHILEVKAGEDIAQKVTTFSQNFERAVCVISAFGAISNAALCRNATSGGTTAYEGWFQLLSLSGSLVLPGAGGNKSRIGGLSVLLSGADGTTFGGSVAGFLIAASPVQVVIGSFNPNGRGQSNLANPMEPLSAPANNPGSGGGGSSPLRGTLSESSGGPVSPPMINQLGSGTGFNNVAAAQGMLSGIHWT